MPRAPRVVAVALSVLIGVPVPAQETAPPSQSAVGAFRAGQEAYQREEFEAAIADFRAAVAADARFAAAWCGLGQTYMTLRRYVEAVDALVQCKALTERQLAAQSAARADQDRDAEREIQALRDAIRQIDSGQAKSGQFERVQMEERLRRLEEARNRGASGGGTGVPPALSFALGTAYLRTHQLEAAERELTAALRQKPDLAEAHNNLAAVYAGLGRWEEAADQARRAEAAGLTVSPALKADIAARHVADAPPGESASPPSPAPASPAEVAIQHDPVACVPADAFPRIEARLTPEGSSSARVFFRTDADAGWFAVRLRSDEERYAAILPRPRSAGSFTYYIEATGDDARTTRTPVYVTAVAGRAEQCAGRRSDAVASASGIIVEPPPAKRPGAKVKAVPPGFSTRGTVGDVGQFEMGPALAIGAGVALAGAAVAGLAAAGKRQGEGAPTTTIAPRPDVGGDITLLGSDPPPGSTISLAGAVSVSVRAVAPYPVAAGPLTVTFSRSSSFVTACATLTGAHPDLRPNEPQTLTVSGRLAASEICGDRFSVRLLRIAFAGANGAVALQTGNGFIPDVVVNYDVVP